MYGIDRRTAKRWRERRDINYIKTPSGKIRYLQRHIDEFDRRGEKNARRSVLSVDSDQGLVDAALAIAEERENTTRRLARAVLDEDFETAKQIAEELIPNEARNRGSDAAQITLRTSRSRRSAK
jgi:hypothetical protein